MKKILFVYHVSNIGGGSYCLLNIIKNIDQSKYIPSVLLSSNGPLVDELEKMGVNCYFIKELRTVPYNKSLFNIRVLRNIFELTKSLPKFRNLLDKLKPDLVYLNTMMLHPYLKICKQENIKTLIHIREHWPEREHTRQRKFAIQSIRKYADSVVAINKYSASMIQDDRHPVTIIYDWIDLSNRYEKHPFSKIFNEDCSNRKVYLCSGGYEKIKGTLQVVEAFSEVITDKESRLLLLGCRPSIHRKGLKKILDILPKKSYADELDQAIAKDGRIKQIPNTYMVKHLFEQAYCVLSYFRIPHANLALAENIILRTPSVAAETAESLEYSKNGELALLFKENDIEDFKSKLRIIDKSNQSLKDRLVKESNQIENLFSPTRNINILNEVVSNILN